MNAMSKRQYEYLAEKLDEQVGIGIISEEAKAAILSAFSIRDGLNIISVIASIGGIFIGAGFLTFVLGSWYRYGIWVQILLVSGALSISLGFSFFTYQKNRFTSAALLYVGVLIYGAMIFLVERTFPINLDVSTEFFIWAAGALLLSSIHKDVVVYVFAAILSVIFIFTGFEQAIFLQAIALIGVFAVIGPMYSHRKLSTFGFLSLVEVFLLYALAYFGSRYLYTGLLFFFLGNVVFYGNEKISIIRFSRSMILLVALITIMVSGMALTFPEMYREAGIPATWISWVFAIILIIYFFYLTSLGFVTPLIGIALIIMRYYFDTFYAVIDRSLFFIVGGVIILVFGYYFETMRRRGSKRGVAPASDLHE